MFKRTLLTYAFFAGLSVSIGTPFVKADTTQLRLAVETTSGDPLNIMLAGFRDTLQANAEEDIELEFFEGGALGSESDLIQLLRAEQVNVLPIGSDIAELDSNFALFDMPFLFADKQTARDALDGALGDLLADSLREKSGLEVLAFGELGFRVISNNRHPINTPEDLSGLKLRTPGSATRIQSFEMLGAAPTPMSLGEVYIALRQGVLDGQENPLSVLEEFSLYEVQEYVSLTNHVYTPITLVMSTNSYAALSSDMQKLVHAAAQEGAHQTRQLSDTSDAELVDVFTNAGVSVNQPNLESFQAAAVPIRDAISEHVNEAFWEQAQQVLELQ